MTEKKKIILKEVCPRDGFQMEKNLISTADKLTVIDRLSESGVKKLQVTAFVHPKAVPNMADAEQVWAGIEKNPQVLYQGLVANRRGYERAAAAGIPEVEFTLSATESHNMSNVNSTTAASFQQIEDCLKLGLTTAITGGVAVVFGCPFEGRPPLSRLTWVMDRFMDLGIYKVTMADTAGTGDPKQVYEIFSALLDQYPKAEFCFHPHNTHNTAIANTIAAIQAGVTEIDAATAGLGGCPFSPGASGNMAMEDIVDILETMGYEERTVELAKIAGYLHDIGNLVNRKDHSQSGAVMAWSILNDMGCDPAEVATIVTAIGNHDEGTGVPVNAVAAAMILADKADVRRSRVRNTDMSTFDIHDRVNYSVKKSALKINEDKTIVKLKLTVDTKFGSVMDYFEIFMQRMILCRKAAEKLGLQFKLIINEQQLI